jgi:hypothetical protein
MKVGNLLIGLGFLSVSMSAYSADQVTEYAKKSGYKACLSTVSDIEKFFGENANYGSWVFVAAENSDDQMLNATLELTYNDGSVLVDFTIVPAKDGTCSYSYTRTWYSEKNCIANSKEDYMKNATYKTEVNKNITAFEDKGGAKILLTPAGNGCLVQKKEIGFRHKKQNS